MTLNVENDALADAVLSRIDADAKIIKAKAALWRSAGLALVLAGTGAGVGLGCLGYSRVVAKQVIAQHEARDAFLAALSHATIKVAGEVKVADGGEVALKKGGTVSVDPSSVVRVSGTVSAQAGNAPRPSWEQLQPASKAGVAMNFVVFKTVKFGAGEVQVGWKYTDGDQDRPSFQYCQYGQFTGNGATQTNVDIGIDGHMTLPNPSPFPAVDLVAAYKQCVWWTESASRQRSAAK